MKLGRKVKVREEICQPHLIGKVVTQGQVAFIRDLVSQASLGIENYGQHVSQARELRLRDETSAPRQMVEVEFRW